MFHVKVHDIIWSPNSNQPQDISGKFDIDSVQVDDTGQVIQIKNATNTQLKAIADFLGENMVNTLKTQFSGQVVSYEVDIIV